MAGKLNVVDDATPLSQVVALNDKQRIIALEARLANLEALVDRLGEHQVSLGASLIRAHQKTMEIEGDLAAVGIGNKDGKGRGPKLIGLDKPKLEIN